MYVYMYTYMWHFLSCFAHRIYEGQACTQHFIPIRGMSADTCIWYKHGRASGLVNTPTRSDGPRGVGMSCEK